MRHESTVFFHPSSFILSIHPSSFIPHPFYSSFILSIHPSSFNLHPFWSGTVWHQMMTSGRVDRATALGSWAIDVRTFWRDRG
jgi:hypothetical protein